MRARLGHDSSLAALDDAEENLSIASSRATMKTTRKTDALDKEVSTPSVDYLNRRDAR
jgi:hypothetical protein